ncbi:hypothetical protein HYV57_06055 [Candidatus Peregrinibacteria bacterium]|nr:hypothetical protein [Candidatus Peregrinibacteria bacterium]
MKQFFFSESWLVYLDGGAQQLPPLAERLDMPRAGSVDDNLAALEDVVSRKLADIEQTIQKFDSHSQVHEEFIKLRDQHINNVQLNTDQTEEEKRTVFQHILKELTEFEARVGEMADSSSQPSGAQNLVAPELSLPAVRSSKGVDSDVLTDPLPPVIVTAPHPEWKGFWKDFAQTEDGATIDFGSGPNALALEKKVTLYDIASRRFDTAHMPKIIEVRYADSSMRRFEALAKKGDKRYEAISAFLKENGGKLQAQFGLLNENKIDYFFTVNGKKEHVPVFQGDIVRPVESAEATVNPDTNLGRNQLSVEEGRVLESSVEGAGLGTVDKSEENARETYMKIFNLIRFDAARSSAGRNYELIGLSKPLIEAKRELSEALIKAGCDSSLIAAIDFSQPKEKEFNVVIKRNDQGSDILLRGSGDSAQIAFTDLIRNIANSKHLLEALPKS